MIKILAGINNKWAYVLVAAAVIATVFLTSCSSGREDISTESSAAEAGQQEDASGAPKQDDTNPEGPDGNKPAIEDIPETVKEDARDEELEPPEDELFFSFTVTGDSRPADDYLPMPDTFLRLLDLMDEEESTFNISVGDIINGQSADESLVKRAFSDYLEATSKIYDTNFVSPGNHDIINGITRKYFREMILDKSLADAASAGIDMHNPGTSDGQNSFYYYFNYNDIHFIILNAFEPGYWGAVKGDQLDWLEGVLEGLADKAVFVTIHTPPYSFLNPDTVTDGSKQVGFSDRQNLEYIRQLFKQYRVDAVFSGHEHVYVKEFHDGTHYIITALAGEYPYFPGEENGFYHYIRVDVRADRWTYNVIGIEGHLKYQEEILFYQQVR